jgi:hypothetical protein
LSLLSDVACGLAFLHAHGILHRDVKPDNVLLDESGRGRVSDVGLAKSHGRPGASRSITFGVTGRLDYTLLFYTVGYRCPHYLANEAELQQLRTQWQETRDSGEKLRVERSRRIKLDRQSAEATRELERLRQEYVKLDRRLQQMGQRLASAEQQRAADQTRLASRIDLGALRQLGPRQVLGVEEGTGGEELGQVRRRFAVAFHSDRVNQLPPWVGRLFDDVLGVVNEACDRMDQ